MLHILNASGKLTPYKKSIQNTVKSTLNLVGAKLNIPKIDIVIKETVHPDFLKDIDGIGAYCPSPFYIELSIDTKHPSFKKNYKKLIQKSLIHELHHAVRRKNGIKMEKSSFLENFVSEGLADYFVYELTGEPPKWAKLLNTKKKKELMKKALKLLNKQMTSLDYEDWFIRGSEKLNIPQFAGYAIGFEIVKNYLEKNKEKKASSLVNKKASTIITKSNRNKYI